MVGTREAFGALAYKDNAPMSPDIVVAADGRGDYTDLETAIDALTIGDYLYIKKGTYIISSALTNVLDNNRIGGSGKGTIIKMADSTFKNIFQINNKASVILEDFVLDGNNANNPIQPYSDDQNCIYAVGLTKSTIRNIHIKNPAWQGVYLRGNSSHTRFENILFERSNALKDAFKIESSDFIKVYNCEFDGWYHGIYAYIMNDSRFYNNYFHHIDHDATLLLGGSTRNKLVNGYRTLNGRLGQWSYGIKLAGGGYNTVSGAVSYQHYGNHILDASGLNIIEGVISIESAGVGILLTGADKTILRNCFSFNNGTVDTFPARRSGISLESSDDVDIIGCVSRDLRETGKTQDYGCRISGTSDYIRIIGGDYRGNSVAPILDESSGVNKEFVHYWS